MPKICYTHKDFRPRSLELIHDANAIIAEYIKQGYKLTLRQLYYQFVARDLIPNTTQSYNRMGSLLSDARLAGLVDWSAIEDRTRNLEYLEHWDSPSQVVDACAEQFLYDKWASQDCRIEVWIEKEALAGVMEQICEKLDVPYLACRGYMSQSEMWAASQRYRRYIRGGQQVILLHFGDHDPSGIDMTRDIRERLSTFGIVLTDLGSEVKRIALNMDQVEEHSPPPNPAKVTDSRYEAYVARFGDESWELDALDPRTLSELVEKNVLEFRDEPSWNEACQREEEARESLREAADDLPHD